jgi:hypothetical protein
MSRCCIPRILRDPLVISRTLHGSDFRPCRILSVFGTGCIHGHRCNC